MAVGYPHRPASISAILLCMLAYGASPVAVQEPASSFTELQALVRPGDTVKVTDNAGHHIAGQIATVAPDSLELVIRTTRPGNSAPLVERRRLTEGDVVTTTLERRDSILNGAFIGTAVAAGPGFFLLLVGSGGTDSVGGAALHVVPQLALAGFAVGALIDSVTATHTTVYRRPGLAASTISVMPLWSRAGPGLQMSVQF